MRAVVLLLVALAAQPATVKPPVALSVDAVRQLRASLLAAAPHQSSIWRDTAPFDSSARLRGVIEIPRGERRKFEFDIAANEMRIDRVMPESLGGYPINYGFVPQTVSYDGDPFDVLVLGPPLASGTLISGRIVGLMQMEDEKGPDSKVVISPVDAEGQTLHRLIDADKARLTTFFDNYKRHEPGKFSRVTGWGSAVDGQAFVDVTHRFFMTCRTADAACVISMR